MDDDQFHYTDPRYPLGQNCQCRLRIWDRGVLGHIAMVTDDGKTTGRSASITNTAEAWATDVVKQASIDPSRTLFVEHYQHPDGRETFDLVRFEWDKGLARHPRWSATSKRAIEIMVRENVVDGKTEIKGATNA